MLNRSILPERDDFIADLDQKSLNGVCGDCAIPSNVSLLIRCPADDLKTVCAMWGSARQHVIVAKDEFEWIALDLDQHEVGRIRLGTGMERECDKEQEKR